MGCNRSLGVEPLTLLAADGSSGAAAYDAAVVDSTEESDGPRDAQSEATMRDATVAPDEGTPDAPERDVTADATEADASELDASDAQAGAGPDSGGDSGEGGIDAGTDAADAGPLPEAGAIPEAGTPDEGSWTRAPYPMTTGATRTIMPASPNAARVRANRRSRGRGRLTFRTSFRRLRRGRRKKTSKM